MKYKIVQDGHGSYIVVEQGLLRRKPVRKFKWFDDAQGWIKRQENERLRH